MKLAVIGSGNIGKSIGEWASKVNYEVIFSAKNEQHAQEVAKAAGNHAKSATVKSAVEMADIILLAVPYGAVKEVVSEVGPLLKGKVLIDATNALTADFSGLALGFTTSAAEEIAKLLPEAKVVKAFNTVFASVYASQNPKIKGQPISVFYAGDDYEAKAKVADMITKMGFDAVDAGPLKAARNLEPMALLNISLGYGLGHGTSIGFSFVR
ncbi:MAG TPA: NADPH-dependent F420 reductase [Prolixibacteraceae bacterium]|jgi:predicted dinucleotide-binding enzyme|nr:NADPH-dependent F420 reductase [Prolixibacteraceae bacterium]